jgi:hypothetical protein
LSNPGHEFYDKGEQTIATCDFNKIVIWDVEGEKIAGHLTAPPPLGFDREGYDSPAYTPDSKLLAVSAYTTKLVGNDLQETKNYELFYDTKTYQLVGQIKVPGFVNTKAISPDSKMLAIAYTEHKVSRNLFSSDTDQPIVVIYDIATGEELARTSHPRQRYNWHHQGIGGVSKIAFTPDGKYLLSSTRDARIWEIEHRTDTSVAIKGLH